MTFVSFLFFFFLKGILLRPAFSIFVRFTMRTSLGCFRCIFQNTIHFTCICITEIYLLLLKIDRYKDGCYLKYISGVGRSFSPSLSLSLPLSLSYSQLCVCSVNVHDAYFNLYVATNM